MQPNETVLVLGASGGVGMAAVQLAKAFGARAVIAGARGTTHRDKLLRLGADHVIDLSVGNLRDDLRTVIQPITSGRGIDVVIDSVGGEAHAGAMRAMAWRGRVVIVGFASNDIPVIKANYLLVKNIAVSGLQVSDYRDRVPEQARAAQAEIFDLCTNGKLDPQIGATLPLSDAAKGLAMLRDGQANGRIILTT